MIAMLVLLLLGIALPAHAHDREAAGLSAISVCSGSDHCPGDEQAPDAGHCCASVHGHACCILVAAAGTTTCRLPQAWSQTRRFLHGGRITTPRPRPPAAPLA